MPVADLVIRIKNGYMAKRDVILAPYSKINEAILVKLEKCKYLKGHKVLGENVKTIEVTLSYDEGVPALTDVKIFSTPGRRWYTSYSELKPVLNGMGHSFISTSKGIMTGYEAKKNKAGGELLFHIW